jgi:hypothetical protein
MARTHFTKTCPQCGRTFQYRKKGAVCCSKHCARQYPFNSAIARLEKRMIKLPDPPGCWLWTGAASAKGYGVIGYKGRNTSPHRLSYETHIGPIPEGLHVCHNCPGGDNPRCFNPAHLFAGTRADNMQDATRKGRMYVPQGTADHRAKLTEADVRAILASDEPRDIIAARYGVTIGYVHGLKARRYWRHLAV